MTPYRKIIHVQTVVFEDELTELKAATKKRSTKDALSAAVEYYLKAAKAGAT